MPAMHAMAIQTKSSNAGVVAAATPSRIVEGWLRARGIRNSPICSETGNGKSVATEVVPNRIYKCDLLVAYADDDWE